MQRRPQDDRSHDPTAGVRIGEAKKPGPGIGKMTAADAQAHADRMRQWAEARESRETEEETDARMPALPAEMRARYARWWDVLRHPPSEWWEVTEGVWRRRRAVVRAELEETTPVRRRSSSADDETDRRESQRVRWNREQEPALTLERLRAQQQRERNPADHGAGPEANMKDGEKKTDYDNELGERANTNPAI